MASEAAEETSVNQIHRLLVEVKDYLDAVDTKGSARLAGKVEFVLDNCDDDSFFGSDNEDGARELSESGGSIFEDSDEE